MLIKVSVNILVQTDERTYAFMRKESSPRKAMYVIIYHFETNQPDLTFSPSLWARKRASAALLVVAKI